MVTFNLTYVIISNICFWIFGICNNYPYVIMLSAAHDIMKKFQNDSSLDFNSTDFKCTKVGTGAILLADILPTFIFKLFAPLFIQKIKFPHKICFVILSAILSFILVGFSNNMTMAIFGIVLASLSSGVGEVTFLSLTAFFDQNTISYWSSGTGGAGVVGALSYAGLTHVISPENTLFAITFVPLIMLVTYFFLLPKPHDVAFTWKLNTKYSIVRYSESDEIVDQTQPSFFEKLKLTKIFLHLTIPLFLVYLAEYVINQAFFELIYINNSNFNEQEQYRWYQATYQIGVFISRSSINFAKIRHTWILTLLQVLNVILFLMIVIYKFIPIIWIVFILILYEGLLGGSAYVNTFFWISQKSEPKLKEFNMAAGSFWDSFGILIAGFISLPIHNALCDKYF